MNNGELLAFVKGMLTCISIYAVILLAIVAMIVTAPEMRDEK